MKLNLKRQVFADTFTLGELFIDGQHFCYTVEDVDRLSKGQPKVFSQTAIPKGTYNVSLTMSPHFGKVTPRLANVPQFEAVLIHSGNTSADTEGCIIIGTVRTSNGVGLSRQCFTKLMEKLKDQKDITITVE